MAAPRSSQSVAHTEPSDRRIPQCMDGWIEEQPLCDHFVMHCARLDANEKLKQEVIDIARAKGALGTASTSSHVEVDACCRGKERARARTIARVKMTARKRRTLKTPTRPRRRNASSEGNSATGRRSARSSQQTRPSRPRKKSQTT